MGLGRVASLGLQCRFAKTIYFNLNKQEQVDSEQLVQPVL